MTAEEAKRRRQEKALRAQVIGMQRRINNFNSAYGNDYISSWKSQGDLDKYYKDVESQYRDVKSLFNLYKLYGTDEEKAHLPSIEKSVKGYEDFLGGKNRAYATYGAFDNKNAYDSYVAQIIADNNRKNYLSTVNIADLERQYREKTSDMTNILGPMDDVKQLEQDIKDAKALQDLAALEKNRENLDYNQEEILNNVNGFSDEPTNGYYSYMTDEEKALYHYLVEQEQKNEGGNVFSNTWNALFKNAADGSTDAERYFKHLEPVLRQRQIDDVQDFARENQVLATGLSFLTNLGAMTTQPVTLVTGEYNQLADVTSALRGGASSTVDEIWQFLYNTGVSGVESALASAIPGPAGEIMLGASAAASAQNDILSRGGTSGQARVGGIAAGVTEAFFEHFSLGMLRQLKSKEIVSSLKIYLGNAMKEVLTNASEEAATEIANVINDQIIMGELSNFNKLIEQNIANGMSENDAYMSAIKSIAKQVGEAAASGALMGFGFSAIGGASGLAQNYSLGSKAVSGDLSKINSLNTEDALIARGNILFENAKGASKAENARIADANALIKKVTENKGKKTVGQKLRVGALMEAVNTESIKEGKTDVAKYLNVQKATETARSEAEKVEVKSGGDIKRSAVPKVVKIDGDKLSQIYVEQDGEAVSLEEMTFDNADIAEAFSLASNFGSVAVANSFMENYIANMDNVTPTEFWTAWAGIMTDGQTLRTDEKLMADVFGQYTDRISTEAKTAAWLAGVENKKGFSEKRRAEVSKIKEEWEKGGKKVKAGTYDDSALKGVKLDKQQKEFVAFARIFSDVFGMNVKLIATKKGARGDNGSYNRTTNTITLDIFAGIGNNDNYNAVQLAVANTLSHEVVHNMREVAYAQYEALQEYVFEVLRARGVDTDELVRYYMNHDKLSRNDAIEEVVAHSCDGMLATSATAREFMSGFYAKNKKAANKFTEFIRSVLKRLKAVFDSFAKRGAYDLESQVIAKAGKSAVEQLQKLYDAGILALREGNLAKNATLGMVSKGATITPDGTVMLQQRQYRETGRASVLEYLTEQYGADTANDMIDTMDKLYAVVDKIKDENPELDIFSQWQETEVELDEEGHPIFTSDIKNGDYVLNQDFSRVCKKRRQLDEVLNWLTSHKDFDVAYLTKDDCKKINDIIRKHGFEVACDLCFVDAKRFRQSEWAESFADTWNKLLDSITVSGTATPFNFATEGTDVSATDIVIDESRPVSYNKFKEGKVKGRRSYANLSDFFSKDKNSIVKLMMTMIVENPEYRHHFRAADIISSKGFDEIQRKMPELRQILNGWGGSSAPKSSSLDAVYDNSILNIKGYNKEAAYAVGGVRMNSFSDFIAHMFFDYCQAFADLAAKELPMQAYSKELTFFLLYGRTGGKLNMSGIPAPRGGAHSKLEIEKQFAGLDVAPLAEYLGKPIKDLTTADCLKHLDMLEYLWAKESIDIKKATLLQSGIRFDKLSDEKIDKCYDLIRQKKFDEAHSVAGRENVDLEYTKNIGIVAVGVSEPHIRKLLRDHTIRMVIPYHSSGINPNIAKAMRIYSYMNYTDFQSTTILFKEEKKAVKLKKKDHKIDDFNFYDYFGKTIDGVFYDAKATANRYIEWCREMSTDEYTIIPKFNEFTNEENYYKLLEDFDCYNTITEAHEAQGAVDFFGDTLPADYKDIITKELKQEQKNRDDFRAELDGTEMREEILDVVRNRGFNVEAEEEEMKQARANTVDGRIVAVVEDDILSGIYNGQWDKDTVEKAKKAAKTALLKFKDGIAVKGITAKVNRDSRREYARSNYSEALRKHDPDTYADKLRAASVVDDVVIAATNWKRDGVLKKPRNEDFVDFDRGQTLIMSGTNKYSATVLVGITKQGKYIFYDVEDMTPTQFEIKNEGDLPTVTPNESFDDILKVSNGNSIPQNQQMSSGSDKNYSEELFQVRHTTYPITDTDVLALKKTFGTTTNYDFAGYLLRDGEMLDFSGKHWGNDFPTGREVDHRDVLEAFGYKGVHSGDNGVKAMVDMISDGNIRLAPEIGGINIAVKPTQKQIQTLIGYIRHNHGEITVDIDEVGGDTIHSFSYNRGTAPMAVIRGIMEYFEEGILPQEQPSYRQFLHQKRIETPSPSALLKAVIRSNDRYKHYGKYTESLKKYQDLDVRIRAAQERVSEIDKEINDIKKKPAKQQNAKRLSELYERKQRESRTITEYRNRQFAMESNELRNIVANETAIARQETQKNEREQFRAKEQARRVRANATNNRRKLMRIVHELDKLLNRGNKKKHVKRGLRSTVETSLRLAQLLTFEQIGNDEVILLDDITIENDTERKYINEYRDLLDERNRIDGEIEKLYNENGADVAQKIEALRKDRDDVQGRINYRAGKLKDLLEREKNRLGKVKVGAILQELEDEYNALKDAEESYIRDMYNDFLAGRIYALKDGLKDVYVKKMTEADLQEIVDLYNAILKTVKGANKAFLMEKNMTIQAMADDTKAEALAKGEKDRDHVIFSTIRGFFTKNLTPTWFFEFIDSKTMTMLAKNLAQAEGEWAKTVREAAEFKERMDEKYGVGEWDTNKTFTFDSKTGKTFEVTLEQLMSIYAYSKQGEEAERHLDNGGIVHAKSILVSGKKPVKNKDGKKINIKMYKIREGAAYKLSPEIRGEMIEELKKNAPKVTEYIDEMVGYLSSDLAKIGNATAEKLYGMEIFNNPYYFPIKSSEFWIRSKQEAQKGTVELKNWGATKERVPNASNPIVLDNFTDVWARHCLEMASFATMTLALEDMNRVFNYSERAGDDYDASSVRGTISRVYGSDYAEYIANLINQLNGGARSDDNVPAVDLLMSLAKAGATAGSLSVIVQQPTAIARAFAYINPKYFLTKPLTLKTLSSEWEELKKYAPVAIIKEMGGYDTGVGKKTTSYINAKQYNTFKEKAKGLVTDSAYRNEAIYYLPSKADELTWTYLWQAVKNEVADTTDLKRGTEEFLKACGERFEDVVRHTQVYDSLFARSELMRMKGTFARMATAFAAEPTLTMNMVAYSFKSGNKKMFASAMTSMLLNAAVVSLVYAARDDDEDETYAEKYIEAFTGEILEGINPITYIPILRDIWSIFLGYDVERLDMSAVADIWKAFEGLFSSKKSPYEKWTDFVGQIALFLGIPVKNLLREGEAVYNMIRMMIELVEGNHTDAEGILEALKEGAENAVPMGEKIFK